MNKEEIEKQLKLSKRQNKDERYDYLCSEFNAINYCVNLEKYTNKLQKENQQLKEEKKKLKNWLEENNKTIQIESMSGGIATYKKKFEAYEILDKIKELEERDVSYE